MGALFATCLIFFYLNGDFQNKMGFRLGILQTFHILQRKLLEEHLCLPLGRLTRENGYMCESFLRAVALAAKSYAHKWIG